MKGPRLTPFKPFRDPFRDPKPSEALLGSGVSVAGMKVLSRDCLPLATCDFFARDTRKWPVSGDSLPNGRFLKNLLMPLLLMGCFPVDFQEVKRPLRTKSAKRPIEVGKRPITAKVLVGFSVGCLMGCFRAPPPWRKTAPLKRPIKRSMTDLCRRGKSHVTGGRQSWLTNWCAFSPHRVGFMIITHQFLDPFAFPEF